MKNLFFIYLAIISLGMITLTSCGDDENATDPDAPVLTANANSAEVAPGTFATFDVTAAVGKDDLSTITIARDGANIGLADYSDVTINGADISANPILLLGTDPQGFTATMGFIAPSTSGTSFVYTVTLTDDGGLSTTETFTVSTPDAQISFQFDADPSVTIVNENGIPGRLKGLLYSAQPGNVDLNTIAVYNADGSLTNAADFGFDSDLNVDNPHTLSVDDRNGFDGVNIQLRVPAGGTTVSYRIELEDVDGNTASLTVNYTGLIEFGPETEGQFYHMDGAAGCTGGYDLVNDADVASSGSDDDRDMLNTDVAPDAFTGSWRSQNGTLYVKDETGNISLSSAKSTAIEAYELMSNPSPSVSVDNPQAGDIYVAKLRGGDDYAIIRIDEVDANDNSCNMSTGNRGKITFTYVKG